MAGITAVSSTLYTRLGYPQPILEWQTRPAGAAGKVDITTAPPRRFELTSCNSGAGSAELAATWLDLAATERPDVWHDRVSKMRILRADGETLAAIGARFSLSPERVRQILAEH